MRASGEREGWAAGGHWLVKTTNIITAALAIAQLNKRPNRKPSGYVTVRGVRVRYKRFTGWGALDG